MKWHYLPLSGTLGAPPIYSRGYVCIQTQCQQCQCFLLFAGKRQELSKKIQIQTTKSFLDTSTSRAFQPSCPFRCSKTPNCLLLNPSLPSLHTHHTPTPAFRLLQEPHHVRFLEKTITTAAAHFAAHPFMKQTSLHSLSN